MSTTVAGRRVRPRHGRRAAPETSLRRRLLLFAAAAGAAVLLAVTASGGTYAFLNSSAAVPAGGSLRAGTASMSVTTALSLPTTAMYPGEVRRASAVITSVGDIPLKLRVTGVTLTSTANSFSGALTLGVGVAASAAACTAGTTTSTWTGTIPSATAGDLAFSLPKTGTAVICVTVTLPVAAPDGARGDTPATFTVQIDGRQV
ncbi:hypothetical protein [Herbiconiux sp. YIM B11900]|uniref:hypothetical protein n=1 Tax=Herbiconiux sp. YIM B11900 TaxID=3404131 RepID=UPI003F858A85